MLDGIIMTWVFGVSFAFFISFDVFLWISGRDGSYMSRAFALALAHGGREENMTSCGLLVRRRRASREFGRLKNEGPPPSIHNI